MARANPPDLTTTEASGAPAAPAEPTLRDQAASLSWDPDELRAFLVKLVDALPPKA